ncbi:hypothetical protein [uncultured Maribacter sp.]|uniref:hypothetical protein n=1 Tax=uncultured Maribacter sp. TaxID=431308 RepID=UPI002626EF98|nr:hypothetical protein [uncultured Maribacter sp.]
MQDLIIQIKEVRHKLSGGDLSVEEAIIVLSTIIDKFNERDETDNEKGYLKSLFTNKKLKEINTRNEEAKKRIKSLKIVTLLHDIGIDQVTEKDVNRILKGV